MRVARGHQGRCQIKFCTVGEEPPALSEADIYLIDEPSAYLDVEQRVVAARVMKRRRKQKGTSPCLWRSADSSCTRRRQPSLWSTTSSWPRAHFRHLVPIDFHCSRVSRGTLRIVSLSTMVGSGFVLWCRVPGFALGLAFTARHLPPCPCWRLA